MGEKNNGYNYWSFNKFYVFLVFFQEIEKGNASNKFRNEK